MNIDGLNEHLFLLANVYCISSSWLVSVCMPPVSWETSGTVEFHFCAVSASFSKCVTQKSACLPSDLRVTVSISLTGALRLKDSIKLVFINDYDLKNLNKHVYKFDSVLFLIVQCSTFSNL